MICQSLKIWAKTHDLGVVVYVIKFKEIFLELGNSFFFLSHNLSLHNFGINLSLRFALKTHTFMKCKIKKIYISQKSPYNSAT